MTDLRDPLALPELAQRAQQVTADTGGSTGALLAALAIVLLLFALVLAPATRETASRMTSEVRDRFRRRPPRRISGPRPA